MPIIENRSKSSASNVIVELFFPKDILFPSESLKDMKQKKDFWDGDYKPRKPKEPDLLVPKHLLDPVYSLPFDKHPSEKEKAIELEVHKREDANMIVYRIENLIQNRPYTDLLPIPVWLANIDESKKIHIPVKIYAKELEEPLSSFIEIDLIVRKKAQK